MGLFYDTVYIIPNNNIYIYMHMYYEHNSRAQRPQSEVRAVAR